MHIPPRSGLHSSNWPINSQQWQPRVTLEIIIYGPNPVFLSDIDHCSYETDGQSYSLSRMVGQMCQRTCCWQASWSRSMSITLIRGSIGNVHTTLRLQHCAQHADKWNTPIYAAVCCRGGTVSHKETFIIWDSDKGSAAQLTAKSSYIRATRLVLRDSRLNHRTPGNRSWHSTSMSCGRDMVIAACN